MDDFLGSNDWRWRLARTVVQGMLGVVVANLDTLMGYVAVDAGVRSIVVALVMAALSPVMAELGRHGDGEGR